MSGKHHKTRDETRPSSSGTKTHRSRSKAPSTRAPYIEDPDEPTGHRRSSRKDGPPISFYNATAAKGSKGEASSHTQHPGPGDYDINAHPLKYPASHPFPFGIPIPPTTPMHAAGAPAMYPTQTGYPPQPSMPSGHPEYPPSHPSSIPAVAPTTLPRPRDPSGYSYNPNFSAGSPNLTRRGSVTVNETFGHPPPRAPSQDRHFHATYDPPPSESDTYSRSSGSSHAAHQRRSSRAPRTRRRENMPGVPDVPDQQPSYERRSVDFDYDTMVGGFTEIDLMTDPNRRPGRGRTGRMNGAVPDTAQSFERDTKPALRRAHTYNTYTHPADESEAEAVGVTERGKGRIVFKAEFRPRGNDDAVLESSTDDEKVNRVNEWRERVPGTETASSTQAGQSGTNPASLPTKEKIQIASDLQNHTDLIAVLIESTNKAVRDSQRVVGSKHPADRIQSTIDEMEVLNTQWDLYESHYRLSKRQQHISLETIMGLAIKVQERFNGKRSLERAGWLKVISDLQTLNTDTATLDTKYRGMQSQFEMDTQLPAPPTERTAPEGESRRGRRG